LCDIGYTDISTTSTETVTTFVEVKINWFSGERPAIRGLEGQGEVTLASSLFGNEIQDLHVLLESGAISVLCQWIISAWAESLGTIVTSETTVTVTLSRFISIPELGIQVKVFEGESSLSGIVLSVVLLVVDAASVSRAIVRASCSAASHALIPWVALAFSSLSVALPFG